MLGLLKRGQTLLLAALIGVAVYTAMMARDYNRQLTAAHVEIQRSEQRAETLLEYQRWQRRRIDALQSALSAREQQLDRDDEMLALIRTTARQLERDDAETADWADRPVPGAVALWLRDIDRDADSDRAGSDDAGDTRVPAQTPAGAGEASGS